MNGPWYFEDAPPSMLLLLWYLADGDITFSVLSVRYGDRDRALIYNIKQLLRLGYLIETMSGADRQQWTYALTFAGRERGEQLAEEFEGKACLAFVREAVRLGRPPRVFKWDRSQDRIRA